MGWVQGKANANAVELAKSMGLARAEYLNIRTNLVGFGGLDPQGELDIYFKLSPIEIALSEIKSGDFSALDVANKAYPSALRNNKEGATFNQSIGIVCRELNKMHGILRLEKGKYFKS